MPKLIESLDSIKAYAAERVPSIDAVNPDIIQAVKEANKLDGCAFDANETLLFARQLEEVDATLYRTVYPEYIGRSLVSFKKVAETTETFTQRIWDSVGYPVIVSDYTTDYPSVAATAREVSMGFYDMGISYQYSIDELRKSARLGMPIDSMQAQAAREAMERALDRDIAFGQPQKRSYGLLNHPNISLTTLPFGTWSTATAEQILADMHALVNAVPAGSLEIEKPDTLLMSPAAYRKVSQTILNTAGGSMTILQAFQAAHPEISVRTWDRLATANAAGTNGRMMAYNRSATRFEFIMRRDFETHGPQQQALVLKFLCRMGWGGLQAYRPKAAVYADAQLM